MNDAERKNIELWIAALESGIYKQGQGSLRIPDFDFYSGIKHCCLGVFAECMIGQKIDDIVVTQTGEKEYHFASDKLDGGKDYSSDLLPNDLWVELFPSLNKYYHNQKFFSWLNDNVEMENFEIIIRILKCSLENRYLVKHQRDILGIYVRDEGYESASIALDDFKKMGFDEDRFRQAWD